MSVTNRKVEMITKVLLEGFPSRNEVLTLLDSFLAEQNYPADYNVNNKDSLLVIMFKKPEIAFDFIKRINIEKLDNPLYSKLKTNMNIDAVRLDGYHSHQNTLASARSNHRRLKSVGYDKPLEKKCMHKSSSSVSCSLLASSPYIDQYEEMKKEMHENKRKWIVNRNFNAYIGKATTGRHASSNSYVINTPSIPFVFRKIDRNKWISPKGFFV